MGKAVVSTTIGAEGLEYTDGRDILIADTPAAFAQAAIALPGRYRPAPPPRHRRPRPRRRALRLAPPGGEAGVAVAAGGGGHRGAGENGGLEVARDRAFAGWGREGITRYPEHLPESLQDHFLE